MNGVFKLLWATDVGAQLEAEHMGMEVFPNKAEAEAIELVRDCGERAIPIIVFVPNMEEDVVIAASKSFSVFNDIIAMIKNGE